MIVVEGPIATTSYGRLRGVTSGGVKVWRGIPFAAPPVGDLRFRAPQPPESWDDTRDALEFGPISHQPPDVSGNRYAGLTPEHSEDCLYLNVWAPAEGGKDLPVMVWIHGGTFITGAGSQPLFDGRRMAERGQLILVTINYRLGPFGFLHLSHLGEGFASNQGLLDQVAALEWVQENIAAFGGDPQRVTVFGESAGSMSIAALLAMPAAKGLFSGAIMQSGASQTLRHEQAAAISAALLAELGISPGGDLQELNLVPAKSILEAAARMSHKLSGGSLNLFFQPVIDGPSLPASPEEAVAGGSAKGIPLLIGTNRDEGYLFFRDESSAGNFEQSLKAFEMILGIGDISELVRDYPASWQGQAEIMTDLYFWRSSLTFAESQLAHAPVWMYRYDWTMPGHPLLSKAVHAAEIYYVFNTLPLLQRFGLEITPIMERLADYMQGAWIAFAHRRNPGTDEMPWPKYTTEDRATLIFDSEPHTVYDPEPEKRKQLIGNRG
ncbi:carboxylesterase/lipase family protein [Paenibacillus sp. sgz500958]|uniref:carboxylesterase/lipase family protein n=1 Tax=Paenibacillus sp. sgz500958 TaxID=3242475 RepID=UPI0036D2FE06